MRLPPLARTTHKRLGLIIAIQAVFWTASGPYRSAEHIDISGDQAVLPVAQLRSGAAPAPLATVQAAVVSIVKLELKPLFDRGIYQVTTAAGVTWLLGAVDRFSPRLARGPQ